MFQLRTARLILRDLVNDDWRAIHAMSQDPDVIRYQLRLRLSDEAEARAWVANAMDRNRAKPRRAYNLAITRIDDQEAIGWLGFGRASNRAYGDFDFDFALTPSARGRGIMAEALREMADFLFEALDARAIYGECAQQNRAAARTMANAGFSLDARYHESDLGAGDEQAMLRYVLSLGYWLGAGGGVIWP